MTTLEIKGDWNILKGKLKQKWATLTDSDLEYVTGKQEELLGRIQKRTGETREAIEKAINGSCCAADSAHVNEIKNAAEKAAGGCCSSTHSQHAHTEQDQKTTAAAAIVALDIPIIHPTPASAPAKH